MPPTRLRNPARWSKYLKRCMQEATARRIERLSNLQKGKSARGVGTQGDLKQAANLRRAVQKITRMKRYMPPLEYNIMLNIVIDTAFKNLKVKEAVSAKEYPKLFKLMKKALKLEVVERGPGTKMRKELEAATEEVTRICGPDLAAEIHSQVKELSGLCRETDFEDRRRTKKT